MNDENATIRVVQIGEVADEALRPCEMLMDFGEREEIAARRRVICFDAGFLQLAEIETDRSKLQVVLDGAAGKGVPQRPVIDSAIDPLELRRIDRATGQNGIGADREELVKAA